jgi:Ca2+-binding EF-hand superfamily protein
MKILLSIVLLFLPLPLLAQTDAADYNRRAAENDAGLFRQLDRDGDGMLTRSETGGDLNLGPRFDDIDINRDGVITGAEMRRYLEQRYSAAAR